MHEIELSHDGCSYAVMIMPRADGFQVHVYRRYGAWVGAADHDGQRFVSMSAGLEPLADLLAERVDEDELLVA